MKALLILAPVAILILWITPITALLLTWVEWSSIDIFLPALIITLLFIVWFVILTVIARTRLSFLLQPLYYLLGSLVIWCSVAYWSWVVYGILLLIGYPEIFTHSLLIWAILALWASLVAWSIYQFEKPQTIRKITFCSPYVDHERSFVYLADIQVWSTTKTYLEKTIALVNSLHPECILFGWDIVDSDDYIESEFEALHTLTVPMYCITWNHEYYHNANKILSYIKKHPMIHILDDTKVTIGEWIELIGIDYRHAKDQTAYESVLDNLVPTSETFSIFMFHEPKWVESTALRGYDLQLYGHTHGGQIFPWNLIARLVYGAYAYGLSYIAKTGTWIYTTYGAGLWGPRMRLWTENEIILFTIQPE